MHRLSKRLRAIPAATSERRALLQLDPFHLAQLALKDATKAAELAPTTKAFELQVIESQTCHQACSVLQQDPSLYVIPQNEYMKHYADKSPPETPLFSM